MKKKNDLSFYCGQVVLVDVLFSCVADLGARSQAKRSTAWTKFTRNS